RRAAVMVAESLGPATDAARASGAAGALGVEKNPVVANFTVAGAAVVVRAAAAGPCLGETFALPFPIPAERPADRIAGALSVAGSADGEFQAATVAA
ncbi:hypothetical protein, partial [Mesorhizobium sp.]|uniref:hypothetical protein n=1 Tax=Mesorhizobium sp. TaxID=1871066 RepID=UPI0025C196B0